MLYGASPFGRPAVGMKQYHNVMWKTGHLKKGIKNPRSWRRWTCEILLNSQITSKYAWIRLGNLDSQKIKHFFRLGYSLQFNSVSLELEHDILYRWLYRSKIELKFWLYLFCSQVKKRYPCDSMSTNVIRVPLKYWAPLSKSCNWI